MTSTRRQCPGTADKVHNCFIPTKNKDSLCFASTVVVRAAPQMIVTRIVMKVDEKWEKVISCHEKLAI